MQYQMLLINSKTIGNKRFLKPVDKFVGFLISEFVRASRYYIKMSASLVLFARHLYVTTSLCSGVLMWEIFTCGEMPYGKTKNADVIDSVCHRNIRLVQPPRCPDSVYELMLSCWSSVSYLPFVNTIFKFYMPYSEIVFITNSCYTGQAVKVK